jgi:sugar transferase (PEP-CTERM system associated)
VRIRILGQYIHFSIAVLAAVETGICVLSPMLAYWALWSSPQTVWTDLIDKVPEALIFGGAMITSMIAMGLYAFHQRARFLGILMRIASATVFAALIVAVAVFLVPELEFGRGVLAVSMAIAFVLLATTRLGFRRLMDERMMRRHVLVYGAGRRAQALTQLRRRTDRRGFDVVGFVRASEEQVLVPDDMLIECPGTLYDVVRARGVSEVVVAIDDRRNKFPADDLLACRLQGINVIEIVSFIERETGKVRVDMVSPSWLIFSTGFHRNAVRDAVVRLFDIAVSALLLGLLWPFMLLAWLAIKLEDGWHAPVLYTQQRVGYEGRLFDIKKFRSMRINAEQDGKPAWASENDPRITRVGGILRRLRIDETPQLLNVLLGDMSFVGPRPERPQFVEQLGEKIPYYHERHRVKPGITGWAQLCYPYGASERDAKEKLQYDLYYVKHRSVVFDIFILLETAEVVLWGRGVR